MISFSTELDLRLQNTIDRFARRHKLSEVLVTIADISLLFRLMLERTGQLTRDHSF